MLFENAILEILKLKDSDLYENCKYSLLHKIIQDATYSSTNVWRYKHADFYWSLEVIQEFATLAGFELEDPLAEQLDLRLPEVSEALQLVHQEHVVPTGLVIRKLLSLEVPSAENVTLILQCARTVCIVTSSQNSRLHKVRMPSQQLEFMIDKWARYRFPRQGPIIKVSPYFCSWNGATITLSRKPDSELIGLP